MNKIFLLGRLVANPEFKINEKEKRISRFRLAVNNHNKSNTLYMNIVAFDTLAELIQKFLQKGSQVFVDGRLEMIQTEDKKTYYSVVANDVRFLSNLKTVLKENTEEITEKTEE
jgi:single-strand DNA-binding protein